MVVCARARRRRRASSFSSMTGSSCPPTMSSVGASTRASASPARSGRPPREITARTRAGRAAAAMSAAAAPVLAPKQPIGSAASAGWSPAQSIAAITRSASRSMSKRNWPVCSSTASSSRVSRSSSSVANPPSTRTFATARLRRLKRLLPLPCAKTTSPAALSGSTRSPSITMSCRIRTAEWRTVCGVMTRLQASPTALSRCPW